MKAFDSRIRSENRESSICLHLNINFTYATLRIDEGVQEACVYVMGGWVKQSTMFDQEQQIT